MFACAFGTHRIFFHGVLTAWLAALLLGHSQVFPFYLNGVAFCFYISLAGRPIYASPDWPSARARVRLDAQQCAQRGAVRAVRVGHNCIARSKFFCSFRFFRSVFRRRFWYCFSYERNKSRARVVHLVLAHGLNFFNSFSLAGDDAVSAVHHYAARRRSAALHCRAARGCVLLCRLYTKIYHNFATFRIIFILFLSFSPVLFLKKKKNISRFSQGVTISCGGWRRRWAAA